MTWLTHHQSSERAAEEAHDARRRGNSALAQRRFADAAEAEIRALSQLTIAEKPRTFGVTAVSAAALLYKAEQPLKAEQFAYEMLALPGLPQFATDQLRQLLQSIWNEQAQASARLKFAPGQVTFSVDGGEIVKGGAPLELIVERVQTIQAIFHRTAEYLKRVPLRRRGPPPKSIQEICRPWLFQGVPGSYQFVVAIQTSAQGDLFDNGAPDPRQLATTFMSILEAAAETPEASLPEIVPENDYRETFLKLARNLAPTGRSFSHLEIRSNDSRVPVVLTTESRKSMTTAIRSKNEPPPNNAEPNKVVLRGVLRAVDLNKDWLVVGVNNQQFKIVGVGETVDDVIGPMVNHAVVVHASSNRNGVYQFIDIELQDDDDETSTS